jgi:hypothetical protein
VYLSVHEIFRGYTPNLRFKGEGREGKRRSFKSHALAIATRPHRIDCFLKCSMRFSAASRKHKARHCLNFCPKCTKTRPRACQFKKLSGGYTPGPPFQRREEGRQREGGIRTNGRKGMGRKDEGEGGGEGREDS